jgi:hypothetical protein
MEGKMEKREICYRINWVNDGRFCCSYPLPSETERCLAQLRKLGFDPWLEPTGPGWPRF